MKVLDRLRGKPDYDKEDARLRAVQAELKDLKTHSDETLDYAHAVIDEVRAVERLAAKGRRK